MNIKFLILFNFFITSLSIANSIFNEVEIKDTVKNIYFKYNKYDSKICDKREKN